MVPTPFKAAISSSTAPISPLHSPLHQQGCSGRDKLKPRSGHTKLNCWLSNQTARLWRKCCFNYRHMYQTIPVIIHCKRQTRFHGARIFFYRAMYYHPAKNDFGDCVPHMFRSKLSCRNTHKKRKRIGCSTEVTSSTEKPIYRIPGRQWKHDPLRENGLPNSETNKRMRKNQS